MITITGDETNANHIAGFRLGFERTLVSVTGLSNVRDAIPFPHTPGNARY